MTIHIFAVELLINKKDKIAIFTKTLAAMASNKTTVLPRLNLLATTVLTKPSGFKPAYATV